MKKRISPFFVRINLEFGIGLLGLSLPLRFNNHATFSGALIKIFSILLFLSLINNLLIFDFIFSPVIFVFKL